MMAVRGQVMAIRIIDDIAGTMHVTLDHGDQIFKLFHHQKLIDALLHRGIEVPEKLVSFETYSRIVKTVCTAYHTQQTVLLETDRFIIQSVTIQ